jgi:putative transposase
MIPHLKLPAAYQLHFYLCLKTRYVKPLLASEHSRRLVRTVLNEVCAREEYSLLEESIDKDHLRLLLSLQPNQPVSKVVQLLKGNISHQFGIDFQLELAKQNSQTLWARGYFARSSGKVDLERAKNYIDSQASHHGYSEEWTKPLKFKNPNFISPAFKPAHCLTILNYHLVLATQDRLPLFDPALAPRLFDHIIEVGEEHKFAVDRIGLMPDHGHFLIEAAPSISVEECVSALMKDTRDWMNKNYWGVLKDTGAWDVWRPSYYAGTVGEYTTAQVKSFLAMPSE